MTGRRDERARAWTRCRRCGAALPPREAAAGRTHTLEECDELLVKNVVES